MSAQFYKATKEGYDGKVIRKPGEVFAFGGKRGSWMVPCDENGKVTETVVKQRDTRLGTSSSKNLTREDLREECRKLGIPFKATFGAADLAALIQQHEAGKTTGPEEEAGSPENPDGGAPGVGSGTGGKDAGGTGNQEVL